MKKLFTIIAVAIFATTFFLSSCKKDDSAPVLPAISYNTATGYVSANTSAKYGDTLNFGVTAKSNGTDKLVKFQILFNNTIELDSTISTQEFTLNFYSPKTILDKEVWKFVTTDIAGNTKADSIIVTGNFGDIFTYGPLTFGAQNNGTEKSFCSYSNNAATMYFQTDAFTHQADIDMFCFYENTASHANMMTIAAPGSNITGIFTGTTAPENYTTKNITYFVKTTLTAAQFDAVANDAAILYSYGKATAYRKANVLTIGDVWAFKIHTGKFGLFKVTAVDGTDAGTLQIAVKIQK